MKAYQTATQLVHKYAKYLREFEMDSNTSLVGNVSDLSVTSDELFTRITGRWVLQILMTLSGRQMRFTSLRQAIPKISANVLTARLRELEAVQLVIQTIAPPPDAFQVYELGPLAQGLRPALLHLERWKPQLSDSDLRVVIGT